MLWKISFKITSLAPALNAVVLAAIEDQRLTTVEFSTGME